MGVPVISRAASVGIVGGGGGGLVARTGGRRGGRSGSRRLRSAQGVQVVPVGTRVRRARDRVLGLEENNAASVGDLENATFFDKGVGMAFEGVFGTEHTRSVKVRTAAKRAARHKVQAERTFAGVFGIYADQLSALPPHVAAPVPTYFSATARPAPKNLPARSFCDVCGLIGSYACTVCGLSTCGLSCSAIHSESRCVQLKR